MLNLYRKYNIIGLTEIYVSKFDIFLNNYKRSFVLFL